MEHQIQDARAISRIAKIIEKTEKNQGVIIQGN